LHIHTYHGVPQRDPFFTLCPFERDTALILRQALVNFEAAAEAGNSDALYNAGLMHKEGRGTPVNMSAAEKFFLRASSYGHFDAIYMLGELYLLGELEGNKIDCASAQRYYRMAGEYGEWAGEMRLGFDAFINGKPDSAMAHYEVAAELGYEVAMANAAWLADNGHVEPMANPALGSGTGTSKEDATKRNGEHRARRLLLMAFEEGSSAAALRLGDYAYGGLLSDGGAADYEQALQYYYAGANKGLAQAAYSVGYMHEHGLGCVEDDAMADHYYRKAIEMADKDTSKLFFKAALASLTLKGEAAEFADKLWAAWELYGTVRVLLPTVLGGAILCVVLWRRIGLNDRPTDTARERSQASARGINPAVS
jgi:TPR repeat protein